MDSSVKEYHWQEYAIEATLLGLFMVAACGFTILLEHPDFPGYRAIADPFFRRMLVGIAMGLTAIGLIYSPIGRRSGAHMNPSITLTYLRLGKIRGHDAAAYVAAQFIGGIAGVMLVRMGAGMFAAAPSVRFAATMPGMGGVARALAGEFTISFFLMTMVLCASNTRALAPYTGILAGALVATYITFEAPISGMSMNPGAIFRFGGRPRVVGLSMDLLRRATARDARSQRDLRAAPRSATGVLRKTQPLRFDRIASFYCRYSELGEVQ